jgi:dTDP-4-dehydrorhamnose reductase
VNIMVTGARGMLGTDACAVLAKDHEIAAFDIDDFDITERDAVFEAVRDVSPEIILHLAAFTDVEASEDDRETAFRSNALGSMNVAAAARQADAKLVYVSTDYVFDGAQERPYLEIDPPRPVNFYGLTKLYGETYVAAIAPKHLIVRTSWLFGPHGRNFIDRVIAKAQEGGPLRVVSDQRGCPTYTLHLAEAVKRAIEVGLEGVIHLTNSGETTWFGLAGYVLKHAGVYVGLEPVSTSEYPAKARRPANSVLASLVAQMSGIGSLPPWEEGVREHLKRQGRLKRGESQ